MKKFIFSLMLIGFVIASNFTASADKKAMTQPQCGNWQPVLGGIIYEDVGDGSVNVYVIERRTCVYDNVGWTEERRVPMAS